MSPYYDLERDAMRFEGLSPAQRLIWYFIRDQGEGQYSTRKLAEALGLGSPHTAHKALLVLQGRGLLEVIEPASGRRPALLRAKPPS